VPTLPAGALPPGTGVAGAPSVTVWARAGAGARSAEASSATRAQDMSPRRRSAVVGV
jgi:hypothetical protein